MTVQSIANSDFKGLSELKVLANKDAQKALPEVAKQFEGIFLQSMLKSMRMGHFLEESSPFRGQHQATFQEMLDAQYASQISNSKGLGLAQMLSNQLQKSLSPQPQESATPMPVNSSFVQEIPKTQNLPVEKPHDSIDDFVKSIWPLAKQAASQIGLDPKILMAQAALETGWGKFIATGQDGASSFNLFNIKSTNNQEDSVRVKTTEYIANTPVKMSASFKKYPSVEQSFNDYMSLIKGSSRYQEAVANAHNPERYVDELHKAGYATDPKYSSKILSIYHGEELNKAITRCGL